jgi:hypothetical protein
MFFSEAFDEAEFARLQGRVKLLCKASAQQKDKVT